MKVEDVLTRKMVRTTATRTYRTSEETDVQMDYLIERFGDNRSKTIRACIAEVYSRLKGEEKK